MYAEQAKAWSVCHAARRRHLPGELDRRIRLPGTHQVNTLVMYMVLFRRKLLFEVIEFFHTMLNCIYIQKLNMTNIFLS